MASPLDGADRDLLETARTTLRERYERGRHHTVAALRTRDGRVTTGVSLKARTGAADVHAEPAALARACLDSDADAAVARAETTPATVVAVKPQRPEAWAEGRREGTRIVSPCGGCREALLAFGPEMEVILAGEDGEGETSAEKWSLASVPSGR